MDHNKTPLLILAGLLVPGAWTIPAYAQEGVLEEVIVTARQREESLRDVPASITAFTESDLERTGIQRPEDFIRLTPGVSIVNAAEVGDTQVNIRGINGARDAENSFAYIVDGVLMTNPAAFNREYADLQQIEILKGPQGALYGRNAAAGAIIVTTRKPTNELEAQFRGSVASDSTYYGAATVGGPIQEDKSYYRLHANWRSSDGFYSNSFLNDDIVDDFENFNLTGRLILEAAENTTIDLKARYGEVDAASITFNAAFALPDFATALAPALDPFFGDGFASFFFEDVNTHNFVFQPNIDPQNDQEAIELSAKIDHDMDWGTLTGWLLYSDINNAFSADGTSGAFGFFNLEPTCVQTSTDQFLAGVTLPPPQILAPSDGGNAIFGPYTSTSCDGTQYQERNQEDLSFEIRLISPADQKLRWIAGLYYLNIEREVGINLGIDLGQGITESLFVPQGGSNPTEQLVHDKFDSDVIAVFGQIAYDVTEDVEVALALRYDEEDREVTNLVPPCPPSCTQFVDFDPTDGFTGGAPLNPGLNPAIPGVDPGDTLPDQNETFSEVQPKLSISWDANDALTVFGSWGVGFKSGGFNNQGSMATVEGFFNTPLGLDLIIEDKFREETSSAFEVGFKSRLGDGRVSLEGAYYHTDVDDMQFFEFLVGPFGLLRVVSNIDDVKIDGVELGLNAVVTEWFNVGVGANFIDSEIEKNTPRPATVGNESPSTPDFTGNIAAQFDVPVTGEMDFIAGVYWSFVGETWFHTVQDETRTTTFDLFFPGLGTADYSLTRRDSYDTLDLRVGLQSDNWSAVVFGSNVTDENYLEEVIVAPEFGGSFIHPGAESRWGVEFTYQF